jgi:hypothetical protein
VRRSVARRCLPPRAAPTGSPVLPEYRPHDDGDGWIELSERALGASRELGEEEEGAISDDAEGLRIWIGEDAYELIPDE